MRGWRVWLGPRKAGAEEWPLWLEIDRGKEGLPVRGGTKNEGQFAELQIQIPRNPHLLVNRSH